MRVLFKFLVALAIFFWLPGGFMSLIVYYFGIWLQAIEKATTSGNQSELAHTGDSNE